ncbi:hypothetical protein CK203_009808 [Vitis vinifera]|uniref:Retrotransposon gag domain-containing protein n=1 Tax=Vitis vinifera TaxID=29760 RepID=A0A438JVQ2_VITVI|nr:hypothetical protein CK203_009808 [Vitis vinifera]
MFSIESNDIAKNSVILLFFFLFLALIYIEETDTLAIKGEKQRGKQRTAAAVFFGTFGALPEVHFLHAIYHFKAQEVKNPTLQTVYDLELKRGRYGLRKTTAPGVRMLVRNSHTPLSQTTSEDVFSEDERLNFWFLGVMEARITLNGQYMASSDLCMPYWIRDQEGRLVRIENPQDTELDICVNIMDPPQRIRILNKVKGLIIRPHIVPLLPNFHGMESENPYAHIKEFEEVCNTFREGGASIDLMRLKLFPFTLKDKAKIWLNSLRPRSIRNWVDLQAEYMEAINACPHHGFDTWLLVSYFYDGMSSSMKQILETMCGGDFMNECPTMPAVREMLGDQANVVGQFRPNNNAPYGNTYNSSWRNHPNFSWKPRPPPYQPQAQTQAPQQTSSVEQAIANLIETQEGDSSKLREVKAVITLRSGKEVDQPLPKSKSPVKYKDPLPHHFSQHWRDTVEKALLDLGASVNLLPYSVYKQLGLGGLKPTAITLSLADRPFLATSNAIINCRNGVMQLTFGNMTLELNIFHLARGIFTQMRRRIGGEGLPEPSDVLAIMSPWRRREEILPLFNKEDSQGAAMEDPPKLVLKPLPVI